MIRKILKCREEFERYMNFKRSVIVIFDGEEKQGYIESHNEYAVKINGEYFIKNCCTFWGT